MDVLYTLGGIALLVMVWVSNAKRKHERREDHEQWLAIAARVAGLEKAVRNLVAERETRSSAESVSPTSSTLTAAATPPVASPVQAPTVWANLVQAELATKEFPAGESRAPETAVPAIGLPEATTPAETVQAAPPPLPSRPREKVTITSAEAKAPALQIPRTENKNVSVSAAKFPHDLEERLGTNWLNKLGIGILVLGIAFFLAYQLKEFGPAGKVMVGVLTGVVLLGAGIWLERKERYRILARAGIGGAWALLFFTSYAMYHVPAAKVLDSEAVDLTIMLAVTVVMVLHTLRYKAQSVTGIAFLLAFLTVSISHSTVYSMTAGALLAAGLAVTVVRMQWFEMEVFGILATYINHFLWLRPIIDPMEGKRHPFPEFAMSAGILLFYWATYRISYVLRTTRDPRDEKISTLAALLNSSLLLALFKYQSAHPEFAFWALLALGAMETLLSQLPITRKRRTAVIVLATVGVTLLVAAFPFRYSGARLTVLWLLEAQAVLLIGIWTKEIVFRRMGMLAIAAVSVQMFSVDAARILGRRMDDADLSADWALALIFLVAAAVLYANAHWVLKRWQELFAQEFDERAMRGFSNVAGVMLAIAAWIAFPETWTAVAWCAIGMALAFVGQRYAEQTLRRQAYAMGFAAVVRTLAINIESTGKTHGVSLRLLSVATIATLLYASSRWSGKPDDGAGVRISQRTFSVAQLASSAYTWAASGLLGLLAWYELRPVGVADAWLVGGLLLLEIGIAQKKFSLRLQSYVALLAAFARIFFVNMNADGDAGALSPRFYSVVPVALGFFYGYWRLRGAGPELKELERRFRASEICCWLGTITIVALMRFELPPDWVAAAWASLVFVLLAIAWRSGRREFLYQGMLLALAAGWRTILHDFYERSYFPAPFWNSRWVTAGTTIAVMIATLPLAFKLRRKDAEIPDEGEKRARRLFFARPEQFLFFLPILLLTWLLGIEMRHGLLTLTWGVEGVAVFLLALMLGERSYRLTGLGILLLCVGKIFVVDVWRLNPRDRYMTFIVMGAALLLVSFLYTRNREKLRQFL